MAACAGGAAQRRKDRWLRLFLRHERMTVRMALAEALHHSCGGEPSGPQHLAAPASETADASARRFLTASALGLRREEKEKEKEKRRRLERRQEAGAGDPCSVRRAFLQPLPRGGEQARGARFEAA